MAVRKRKLKSGTKWFVDIRLPNGKRIRKHIGTKKQAVEYERKMIAESVEGKLGISERRNIRFDKLMAEYLPYAEATKAPNTFYTDRCRIESHLLPHFTGKLISQITPKMLDDYKQMRIEEGASPNTVNHELTNLSHMFRMAIRWGYMDRNVVTSVDKMKVAVRSPRFLVQEEMERLAEAAKDSHIYPLIMTAMHTGMRKSELFNLKWADVNFDNHKITIQPKPDWNTKNYKSRHVPITPALYEILWEHRQRKLRRGVHSEYVFTYNGRQLKSNIKRSLTRVLKSAGSDTKGSRKVTLHVLRHTFCSHLVMAGVPLRDVQELMGHQSYETTLQYAHLAPDHSIHQVSKLPFANGFGKSRAHIGHTEVISIDSLKKKEPREVASSQGS